MLDFEEGWSKMKADLLRGPKTFDIEGGTQFIVYYGFGNIQIVHSGDEVDIIEKSEFRRVYDIESLLRRESKKSNILGRVDITKSLIQKPLSNSGIAFYTLRLLKEYFLK